MCVNCGVSSCSSCNQTSFIPNATSALKYDGPTFTCSGKGGVNFTIAPCNSLNQTVMTLAEAICSKNGGGLLLEEIVEISSAEILDLHNNPKLILPASVTHGYDIHSVTLIGQQVTTDYVYTTPGDDYQLAIKAIGPTVPAGETSFSTGGFLETINGIVGVGVTMPGTKMVEFHQNPFWTANDQTGIYLTTTIPGESYTLGDHTLTLIITYRELTL